MLREQYSEAKIAIDGAISPAIVRELAADVDMFILGTAGLFRKEMSYQKGNADITGTG